MSTETSTHDEALNFILRRVLMTDRAADGVLHEHALAEQLGMSRTPVRQILQELALAGLVETRAGYGTVLKELLPQDRVKALRVYQEIASAAANCSEGLPVSDDAKIDMVGRSMMIQKTATHDRDLYARYTITISQTMASIIEDGILAQALTFAHWRVIRWRLRDYAADPDAAWGALRSNMQKVVAAMMENDTAKVLRTTSGISRQIADQPADRESRKTS